jgi:hypothetical protein
LIVDLSTIVGFPQSLLKARILQLGCLEYGEHPETLTLECEEEKKGVLGDDDDLRQCNK